MTDAPAAQPRLFRASLEGVHAYQAGMTLEEAGRRYARSDFAKLASNENLHGCSPKVYEALRAFDHLEIYPDPYSERLRGAIAHRLGVEMGRVILGAGSETLIDLVIRAVIEVGDRALISSPTFPLYASGLRLAGAQILDIPRLPNFDLDVEATTAELRTRPKLAFICSPNNPTGNAVADADLERIIEATPAETLLVIDEAYHEFNAPSDPLPMLERRRAPWMLLRTFSKAYALAGARVGYGIASSADVVGYLDRLRPAFNITAVSQAAALAAWRDPEHMARTVEMITGERERVIAALEQLQVRCAPSRANFVFLKPRLPYQDAAERLLSLGLIVRPIPVGEDGWLRVTIGRPADNDRLLEALPQVL
jgi:histidinol-phosphate aminotransferase